MNKYSTNNSLILLIPFLTLLGFRGWAQKQKDTIDTQVVKVITAYTPSISDAFKIRENPKFKPESFKKKKQSYLTNPQIISSDFQPSLGGYIKPPKKKSEQWFENFLKLGYGNFNTPTIQTFIHKDWDRNRQSIFFDLYNISSDGNVKDIISPSAYGQTNIKTYYSNSENKLRWLAGLSYDRNTNHWYGIDTNSYTNSFIESLDVKQQFQNFGIFGALHYDRSVFKTTEIRLDWFVDKLDNNELHILLDPNFEFELFDKPLKANTEIQLVKGSFSKDAYDIYEEKNYHFTQVHLNPQYPLLDDKFKLNLGFHLNYLNSSEDVNAFGIFPDIKANFGLNSKTELSFGMLGGQEINSYKNFANNNPFVSPHIILKPTQTPYNLYISLKGSLSKYLKYHANIGFKKEKDKAFFTQSDSLDETVDAPNYLRGNGLTVAYDELQSTEINIDLTSQPLDQLEVKQKITYTLLNPKNFEEAWHLPNLYTETNISYSLVKWQFEIIGFYVGERKALVEQNNINEIKSLKSYFDLNTKINYQFNSKFSAFLQTQNTLNQNYERFAQFPVQGFQVLGGFVYHFNI